MLLLRRCLHSYYCTFSMGFSLFTIYAYTFCFTVPCRHADRMGSLQIPAGPSRLIPTWLIYELFSLCSLQFGSFSRRSLFRKDLFLLPFWLGILNKWNIYICILCSPNDTIIVILITNLFVVFIITFLIF